MLAPHVVQPREERGVIEDLVIVSAHASDSRDRATSLVNVGQLDEVVQRHLRDGNDQPGAPDRLRQGDGGELLPFGEPVGCGDEHFRELDSDRAQLTPSFSDSNRQCSKLHEHLLNVRLSDGRRFSHLLRSLLHRSLPSSQPSSRRARARRLLIVEDTFAIRRRGIVLAPFISINDLGDVLFETPIEVELRLVDGSARRTRAVLTVPRIADMTPPYKAAVRLPDAESGNEVTHGTEVRTLA